MESSPQSLSEWIKQVKEFKAGVLGYLVVALTLVSTVYFAFQPEQFFGPGTYPRLVLMLPGLVIGGLAFVLACAATWAIRKPRA